MKRLRCPKCQYPIVFDETRYEAGQRLVFQCPSCGKESAIRMGAPKPDNAKEAQDCGSITVIENRFCEKQVIPLCMGDNVIGRKSRGGKINCPIETDDPSVDLTHCVINVSRDKKGALKYVLRDGPSFTGTFVGSDILGDRERRVIDDGTLFTIGATSILLNTAK